MFLDQVQLVLNKLCLNDEQNSEGQKKKKKLNKGERISRCSQPSF